MDTNKPFIFETKILKEGDNEKPQKSFSKRKFQAHAQLRIGAKPSGFAGKTSWGPSPASIGCAAIAGGFINKDEMFSLILTDCRHPRDS